MRCKNTSPCNSKLRKNASMQERARESHRKTTPDSNRDRDTHISFISKDHLAASGSAFKRHHYHKQKLHYVVYATSHGPGAKAVNQIDFVMCSTKPSRHLGTQVPTATRVSLPMSHQRTFAVK